MKNPDKKNGGFVDRVVFAGIALLLLGGFAVAQIAVRYDPATDALTEPVAADFYATNQPPLSSLTNALENWTGNTNLATAAQGQLAESAVQATSGTATNLTLTGTTTITSSTVTSGTFSTAVGNQGPRLLGLDGSFTNVFPYYGSDGVPTVATITSQGRNLLDDTSFSAMRTTLELGNSATLNVGTTAGTVAAGDDSRIVNAVQVGGTTTNITVTGSTTLGDAAGDTLTIHAGTVTAPNATGTTSTSVANVGTLKTILLTPDATTPRVDSRVQLGVPTYVSGAASIRGHATVANNAKVLLVGDGWVPGRILSGRLSLLANAYGYLETVWVGHGSALTISSAGTIVTGGAQYHLTLSGTVTVSAGDVLTGNSTGATGEVFLNDGTAGPTAIATPFLRLTNGKLFTSADTDIAINGTPSGTGVTTTTFGATPGAGLYVASEPSTLIGNTDKFNVFMVNTTGSSKTVIWDIYMKK